MHTTSSQKGSTGEKEDQTSYLQLYTQLKRVTSFSPSIQSFFSILEDLIHADELSQLRISPQLIQQIFISSFEMLSLDQKAYYLYGSRKFLKDQLLENEKFLENTFEDKKEIQANCQIGFMLLENSYSFDALMKVDKEKKFIFASNTKKNILIDLKHHLVRKSEKQPKTLFLEKSTSINEFSSRVYAFTFQTQLKAKQIYQQIFQGIIYAHNERFLQISLSEQQQLLINSINIEQYKNEKEQISQQLKNQIFSFQSKINDLTVEKSRQNLFKIIKSNSNIPQFLTHKNLHHFQILKIFSEKQKLIYEKFDIKDKTQQLVSFRSENQNSIFVKGIQTKNIKRYLQYLYFQADQQNNLNIFVQFCGQVSEQNVKNYLEELISTVSQNQIQQNIILQKDLFQENFIDKKDHLYLTKKHQQTPLINPIIKLMTQHFLFKEWGRMKNGGLVCINQSTIAQHKKILKSIFTMLKNNLFSGNSIMNISLPVGIFKKQSHLVSIGRDFCYAPLFLNKEGVNRNINPLQRMKYLVLLAISISTLGISMDKPFNPILGQTLQLWIGGCPMYLQQISHHPPIGSYYMVGQRYKIYGQIQPKISFGMNSMKGYSQRPNFIQFQEDSAKIQLSFGTMLIKGMIFGERQFNLDQKVYVYDTKNNIFAEICYGPKKRNIFMKSSEPDDFVHGKIYSLKEQFLVKFAKNAQYPSKQFILQELSSFQGIWNESIKFEGEQYINFNTDLPCELQFDQYQLPSSSIFRSDVIKLQQENIEEAQKEKERLQQLQRRDRKLRQKKIK